ncbi:MAG: DMT family transporter [Bacteroidaceae bacterium]|nr:DMT family transporter [Bacteroidaceae bacterium]
MIWLLFAFLSAALLGFYDVFKKKALRGNAVVPVLFLNTLFCSLIFLPVALRPDVPFGGWAVQKYIVLKSLIVLSSWLCGYYGMKYLPLTLVGPINATRPVMVLLGALLVFGERLNLYQWVGVVCAIVSFYLLSRSGKKEGIDFRHNRWILLTVLAAIFGAVSGLYDKFLMASPEAGGVGLNRMTVQSYFNFYQCLIMAIAYRLTPNPSLVEKGEDRGRTCLLPSLQGRGWVFWVLLVSLFLSAADFAYFYALSLDGALISVVSMVRRSSVIVSFLVGAIVFREKNLRSKAIDLALVLIGMIFLYLGAK